MSVARPRRRLPRWAWFPLAFLLLPLAELVTVALVGRALGGWQTTVLLVAACLVGALVLRREGPATWRRLQDAARRGRTPSRELADGGLLLLGGVLLLVPGFLTDVVGLVCVLPPTRPLARRLLQRWFAARVVQGLGPVPGWAGRQDRVVEGDVVIEGEVLDGQDPDEGRPRPGG